MLLSFSEPGGGSVRTALILRMEEPNLIKYEIPEILKDHEDLIKRTFRYSNEISFKREETEPWEDEK